MTPNTGPFTAASRRQTLATGLTAHSQDLQITEDRTLVVYSSRGLHPRRGSSLSGGVFCRERWKIPGVHCGRQTSQDGYRGLRQYFQGIFDQPPKSQPLSFHPAVVSRNYHMEAFVTSERSAIVGSFHFHRHSLLSDSY